ncbi:galactan export ABC transporter permease subunit Wzm/RfbD [Speluncibacter jeojiensis]|uniref:galactan export ABC transporter permease subunit Wzm/RfbD n=1 Tax=Speluncibacter jeojiensis TaxID=2710754 RepID=UPI0038CDA070
MSADVSPAVAEQRPVVSDSRTFKRAFQDLRDGWQQRELWLHLGWQDIKQKYRRSVLGPFWITIATGVMALALGLLYSVILDQQMSYFLPYLTVGLIIWTLIQGCILEGSEVFIANEGLIKQLPSALSVHVYRLVWRQLLLFAHNLIIYVILILVFLGSHHLSWSSLMAIPALALLVLNGVWASLLFGIFATRYRDIAPLLNSMVQLLFYVTPIVWTTKVITDRGGKAADRAKLAEINPLYHYLDIIRAPMLGEPQQAYHWYIVIGCTVVGWALALLALRNYRARVPYWV